MKESKISNRQLWTIIAYAIHALCLAYVSYVICKHDLSGFDPLSFILTIAALAVLALLALILVGIVNIIISIILAFIVRSKIFNIKQNGNQEAREITKYIWLISGVAFVASVVLAPLSLINILNFVIAPAIYAIVNRGPKPLDENIQQQIKENIPEAEVVNKEPESSLKKD